MPLPQGLCIHIAPVRDIMVPWTGVRDIVTHDLPVTADGTAVPGLGTDKGVTMLLISQDFDDRATHVEPAALRGPCWSNVFALWQDWVAIALRHSLLGIGAPDLRRAVALRWRTFGTPPAS